MVGDSQACLLRAALGAGQPRPEAVYPGGQIEAGKHRTMLAGMAVNPERVFLWWEVGDGVAGDGFHLVISRNSFHLNFHLDRFQAKKRPLGSGLSL